MGYGARIRALWQAAADQDGEQMARFFTEDAVILWPNTNERFTASEYIRANCAYPGQWQGQVERAAPDGSSSVARVWNRAGEAFRAVSFYRWEGDRISRLEEYWGDTAPAPAWPPLPVQRPAKISSDFPDEGFYARGLSSDSWYINAPL